MAGHGVEPRLNRSGLPIPVITIQGNLPEGFTPLPKGFTPLPEGFTPIDEGERRLQKLNAPLREESSGGGQPFDPTSGLVITTTAERALKQGRLPPELTAGPSRVSARDRLADVGGVAGAIGKSNFGDVGLGDVVPGIEFLLSGDDLLQIKAREEAGEDIGLSEKIAVTLAVPLSAIPFIGAALGRGIKLTAKQIEVLIKILKGNGNGFTDEQIHRIVEGLRKFEPEETPDVLDLDPTDIIEAGDPIATARTKLGTPTVGAIAGKAKGSLTDRMITRVLDDLRPVKIAARTGAKRAGLTPDLSSYREMRLVAGVRGVIEVVQKRGTVNFNAAGDVVFTGKGLNEVFRPIADDLDNAMMYFAGRRAQELAKRGKEKLFTPDEITAMVRFGDLNPAFDEAFQEYQAFNRRLLDFAESSGLLSAKQKAKFIEMGQNYVPFYRVALDDGKAKITGSLFARLKGGTANVNEIADNIFRNMVMIVEGSVKNAAKRRVYDMIDALGLDDFAVRIRGGGVSRRGAKAETELDGLGVDNAKDVADTFTFNTPPGENIDVVFRDGKRIFYEVKDPVFLKAMQAFTPKNYNLGMRILGGFKNTLTRLVTASPDFMLVNLLRDTQAAYLQSKAGFIPIVSSIRGFGARLTRNENYWQLLANGGGFATVFKGETGAARNLKSLYTKRGINFDRVLTSPRKLLDAWEEISSSFEMAARVSEFRLMRTKGASARDAALGARDVSTDFAKRGQADFVRFFTTSVPFMNARMQGLSRLVEVAKKNPAKLALKGLVTITVPSLALHAYNRNDPRYQELPDWVRDLHWVIFVPGSDEPYLIPKGFEFGAIFATIPERMFDGIAEKHGEKFADAMLNIVGDQLSMNPIPQAVKPLVELDRNRSFFFDKPIVPADLKAVKPSEQFRPWTSETMSEMARLLSEHSGVEVSPMEAEHLVRGYLGTIGMYALDVADMMVRSVSDKGSSPSTRLDEIPVVRRFLRIQPLRNTRYQADFYDLLGATREVVATFNKVLSEARKPNLSEADKKLFGGRKVVEQVATAAAQINKGLRLTVDDRKMSGDEKRRRIDRLLTQRNALFETFMSRKSAKGILRGKKATEAQETLKELRRLRAKIPADVFRDSQDFNPDPITNRAFLEYQAALNKALQKFGGAAGFAEELRKSTTPPRQ